MKKKLKTISVTIKINQEYQVQEGENYFNTKSKNFVKKLKMGIKFLIKLYNILMKFANNK